MHWACRKESHAVIKLLVNAGANLNLKNNAGLTPLEIIEEYLNSNSNSDPKLLNLFNQLYVFDIAKSATSELLQKLKSNIKIINSEEFDTEFAKFKTYISDKTKESVHNLLKTEHGLPDTDLYREILSKLSLACENNRDNGLITEETDIIKNHKFYTYAALNVVRLIFVNHILDYIIEKKCVLNTCETLSEISYAYLIPKLPRECTIEAFRIRARNFDSSCGHCILVLNRDLFKDILLDPTKWNDVIVVDSLNNQVYINANNKDETAFIQQVINKGNNILFLNLDKKYELESCHTYLNHPNFTSHLKSLEPTEWAKRQPELQNLLNSKADLENNIQTKLQTIIMGFRNKSYLFIDSR